MPLFDPVLRALAQFDEPIFIGVVVRSVLLSLLCFILLAIGAVYGLHAMLASDGALGWIAGAFGGAAALIIAVLAFLPLASVIATLFTNPVAAAVEHRFYPYLGDPTPAPMADQVLVALALGCQVLLAQVIALLLAIFLPGLGLLLGWVISAWAFGRGLFVAVAMRRMPRAEANALYRSRRFEVLVQGALITLGNLLPILNLFIPVLGTAALVHVLHRPDR